jgi:CRISPR system Cascade subunit CasA
LWAFGYDMDNMKARCWYESRIPLYGLADCPKDVQREVEVEVGQHLAAAELAAFFLRSGVKDAWFGADARGDFSHIDASFWGSTEPAFYRQLERRIAAARDGQEFDRTAAAEQWLATLKQAITRLFDEVFVGAGAIERQHPRRAAEARRKLMAGLRGNKLRESLGLPVSEPAAKKARKTNKISPIPPSSGGGTSANRSPT